MHICLVLNSYLIAVDWNWYCMNNLDVLFRAAWLEAEKYIFLAALANHLYSSYSARADAQPVGLSWERSSTQIFHPLARRQQVFEKKRNPAQETVFYSLIALRVKLCGPQSFNSKVPTGTLDYNLAFMHPLFDLLVAYYPVNQSIIYVFILFIN